MPLNTYCTNMFSEHGVFSSDSSNFYHLRNILTLIARTWFLTYVYCQMFFYNPNLVRMPLYTKCKYMDSHLCVFSNVSLSRHLVRKLFDIDDTDCQYRRENVTLT